MASNKILVSYLISKGTGRSSGMRILQDGRAETKTGLEPWQKVAKLNPGQVERILQALRTSAILELPAHADAPEDMFDSPACEWQASFDGHTKKAVIGGWDDQRADDLNMGKLMDQMYTEISEAQTSSASR